MSMCGQPSRHNAPLPGLVRVAPAIFLALLTSGCCSVFLGSRQQVSFNTYPPGASFTVDGQEHRTPAQVELRREGRYSITFRKDGFKDQAVTLQRKLHPLVWLSFYFYIIPGFVDMAAGTAYRQMPDTVLLGLEAQGPQKDGPLELSPPPPGYQVPTLAVWQLTVLGGVPNDAAMLLTEKLRVVLQKSGWYSVIDRQLMEKVMKEQQVELSRTCDTTDCAVEYGQYLSASKVAVGSVGRVGATCQVVLKIIDVQSGKPERVGQAEATGGDEVVLGLAQQAVADLLHQ